jgi:type VI secretion system protein ImpH
VLSDYFSTTAKVDQFFGQWLSLTEEDVTRLAVQNSTLGVRAIVGSRIWDQQSKFRVRLGPLSFKQYTAFLPNGSAHKSLRSIITFMVGMEFDFDVQLVLSAKQVPGMILTTRAVRRPMLGWTTWLKTKPFKTDDDQVVLRMEN